MAPKTATKRKVKPEDVFEDSSDVEKEEKPKKKSKPRAKKEAVATEPFRGSHGWEVEPTLFLLWRTFGKPRPSKKIAAFDLDGTLVVDKKETSSFQVSPDNWKWFNKTVPGVLEDYHAKGYSVVILSNQNSVKGALEGKAAANVTLRATNALSEVQAPLQVIMATQKNEQRKPNTGMWEFFLKHCAGGVAPDLKDCFFVGDMAGRPGDIDVTDKQLAENIGIKFMTPEECFGPPDSKPKAPVAMDGVNRNQELTDVFRNLADLHAGEHFKVAAYTKVAKAIELFPEKITSSKQVANVKGIGKGSIATINEFLTTGKVAALDEAGKTVPKAAGAADTGAFKFA